MGMMNTIHELLTYLILAADAIDDFVPMIFDHVIANRTQQVVS